MADRDRSTSGPGRGSTSERGSVVVPVRSGTRRLGAIGLVVALGAAACSDDDDAASGETTDPAGELASSATVTTPETDAEPAETDAAPATEAPTSTADPTTTVAPLAEDRSYYVLPPGNYGGIPTGPHSLDQLPLYDGLTPLRGDVTDADIDELFLAQDLEPIGATTPEPIDRPGTSVVYDEWGVAPPAPRSRTSRASTPSSWCSPARSSSRARRPSSW